MILSDVLILPESQLQTLQVISDYDTNSVTHRIFNTDLSYPFANFLVEIDKKNLAIMAAFNTI